MDLRMVKTRRQIKDAFLKLREKMTPDKIKVKDICELAMINKTTFYHHYTDSKALADEIDNHAIDRVLLYFPERDKIFEDPHMYITGLLGALEREAPNLRVVFRGKQETLCEKLEERLYALYGNGINELEDGVLLSFTVGGFVRVIRDYLFVEEEQKTNTKRLAESLSTMVEMLLKRRKPALDAQK